MIFFFKWNENFFYYSDHRIIVKDLTEDLYDGQILGKLVEKLSGQKLAVVEVTQNEDFQRAKLKIVLEMANRLLGLDGQRVRWTDKGIHNKNTVEIIHLLVALIRFYRAPIRLPPNVQISILIIQVFLFNFDIEKLLMLMTFCDD